jgi:hypothetical protein
MVGGWLGPVGLVGDAASLVLVPDVTIAALGREEWRT